LQAVDCDPGYGVRKNGPPPRPPSALPEPGHLRLTLKLGETLGDGRCGVVWATENLSLVDPAGKTVSTLPALVAKIALGRHCKHLVHEASVYEEMESIQGIAVPRCYGYFETSLSDGSDLSVRDEFNYDEGSANDDDDNDDNSQSSEDSNTSAGDDDDSGQSSEASEFSSRVVGVLLIEYIPHHLPFPLRDGCTDKIDG
jgi:hypothetical protein